MTGMVNSGKLLYPLLLVLIFVINCSEDFTPEGLYGYQVERLLTNDSNKIWTVTRMMVDNSEISMTACADSLFLLLTSDTDSVSVSSLVRDCSTTSELDTTFLGKANTSTIGLVFSDSLLFASGDYWLISNVRPSNCEVRFEGNGITTFYQLVNQD